MVSRLLSVLIACVLCVVLASAACADSLSGSIKYKDGSKAGSEIGVSTSWNSKKAYPKNGFYRLDFGGKVGTTISVYVKGTRVGRVLVSGDTRLNIIVP